MPVFEYFAEHPEYSAVFNDAMTLLSAPVAGAAIEAYDFSQYGLIVDVGGGHGEVLMSILKACPDVRGVLAEVGHVVKGAKSSVASLAYQVVAEVRARIRSEIYLYDLRGR